MNLSYSGNIEGIASIIDRVNGGSKILLFPTNRILQGKLEGNAFQLSGLYCVATGRFKEQQNSVSIDLRVRLKRVFYFLDLFIMVFMFSFLWIENITINGDTEPTIWKRIGAVAIGLFVFLVIPRLILKVLRNDFETKVLKLLK